MKSKLELFLKQNKIWYRFIDKPETIHTADAACVAGVNIKQLTKSLVLKDKENKLILAIIPGDCRLKIGELEKILKIKGLKLVPFDQAEKYSGYSPGATPPIGHERKMIVVLDKKLLAFKTVFGGGGNRGKLIELEVQDVIKLDNAVIANIAEVTTTTQSYLIGRCVSGSKITF